MIRKLFCIALLGMLAACAAPGQNSAQQVSSNTSSSSGAAGGASDTAAGSSLAGQGATCNDDPVQSLTGSKFTPSLADQARTSSGSSVLQVVKPGQVMTMEYNPARLDVIVDENGVISSIHCG